MISTRILTAGWLALAISLAFSAQDSAKAPSKNVPMPADAPAPQWLKPTPVQLGPDALSVRKDKIELIHSTNILGGFEVRVDGHPMAIGQNHPRIGYVIDNKLAWLNLAEAAQRTMAARKVNGTLLVEFHCTDADGGNWSITQRFTPGRTGSAIDIRSEVICDRERAVAFIPMFMCFPGAGSFGSVKGQGLFAGLEYLENEPSSSEADIVGPGSKRQVPDNLKITIPLMAVQNAGRFLALSWQARPHLSALYDSPDRLFDSGGHVMAVLYPGSNGKNRKDGNTLPSMTETLPAGETIASQVTLMGGAGDSVVPAIRQYVAMHPLPDVPVTLSREEYVSLTAGGWLDSKIHEGKLFRHAVTEGNFAPGPAGDAAVWMDWLAARTDNQELASRLRAEATNALATVAPADFNVSGVGHVRYPVGSLIYGHVAETAARASQHGHSLLAKFEPDFSVKYHPQPGGIDYAKTHYTNEANGYTSRAVEDLLEAAAFSGDRDLITAGLERLQAMKKFHDGVPRGAQTWECPLHIPDILASAQMVRAYTLGYELSGQAEYLDEARYWAWTGVPFVYLVNPTAAPTGLYATIAVFGATQWKAPVWLGLPVQWCGLVYSDALYRLVRHDPSGPWQRIADGISASGVRQAWPASDKAMQGLLPDSFVLRSQQRNGPAINPATLLASASVYYSQPRLYDFASFRLAGLRVHAPGSISATKEEKNRLGFQVDTWVDHPYYVLINGLTHAPKLKINGKPIECSAPHEFQEKEGRLILKLEGTSRIHLDI